MSTATEQAIEFRCRRCWQTIYAPITDAGGTTSCHYCEEQVPVPEGTPSNIRSADVLEQLAAVEVMTEDELIKQEVARLGVGSGVPVSERDFHGIPNASIISRLGAVMVDSLYMMFIGLLSCVGLYGAFSLGVIKFESHELDNASLLAACIIYGFFLFVGMIVQWNLIATRGQTIGKMLLGIRIVTTDGRLPGFVKGVVLRDWLRALLGVIPFFSLIDIAFIFSDSQRCIHDYLAGTRVVQAL